MSIPLGLFFGGVNGAALIGRNLFANSLSILPELPAPELRRTLGVSQDSTQDLKKIF